MEMLSILFQQIKLSLLQLLCVLQGLLSLYHQSITIVIKKNYQTLFYGVHFVINL